MTAKTPPPPSARLRRAAAAERADLDRHRDQLLRARESLRAELDRIEQGLAEIQERRELLARLAPHRESEDPPASPVAPTQVADAAEDRARRDPATRVLRGPKIREQAVRILAEQPEQPQALHYRRLYEMLTAAGYEVAGKKPLAVFLTQISRSPVVRKTTQSGVYELDLDAPERLRTRLYELQRSLRELTATSATPADLSAIRAQRQQLTLEISHIEKALEEADRVFPHGAEPRGALLAGAS